MNPRIVQQPAPVILGASVLLSCILVSMAPDAVLGASGADRIAAPGKTASLERPRTPTAAPRIDCNQTDIVLTGSYEGSILDLSRAIRKACDLHIEPQGPASALERVVSARFAGESLRAAMPLLLGDSSYAITEIPAGFRIIVTATHRATRFMGVDASAERGPSPVATHSGREELRSASTGTVPMLPDDGFQIAGQRLSPPPELEDLFYPAQPAGAEEMGPPVSPAAESARGAAAPPYRAP
jgi:hypothetical protein